MVKYGGYDIQYRKYKTYKMDYKVGPIKLTKERLWAFLLSNK